MPTATADRTPSTPRSSAVAASATPTGGRDGLRGRAARRVPAASTVAFRIAFGLLVTYSSIRFLVRGWVDEFYVSPTHHLTVPGFDWVRPWSAPWMHLHVGALAVLGMFIACGVRTRLAAAAFAVGFAYVELIDRALYLNHYWFMTLAAVWLAVLPGPSPLRHRGQVGTPRTVPAVTVWTLRVQLAGVYVFAGIAKLNPDWLGRGEPLHTWLAARTDRALVGPLLDQLWLALTVSWAGAAFDLTIVAWLLWGRSRPYAYAVLVAFHLATAMLFQIGVFPWVMIALTPICFAPDWPSRLRRWPPPSQPPPSPPASTTPTRRRSASGGVGWPLIAFLTVSATINVALPLRHWFADGNVRWNDDGYELSWRVMLTDRTGYLEFDVVDPASGQRWRVGPEVVLAEWQIAEAASRPPLALHTAHLVLDHFAALGHPDVEVRADSFVAMNGRLRQRMIDPHVDLATISRWAPASAYVLPLDPAVRD